MSAAYITIGAKNYLGEPLPDIEVYWQTAPNLIPVTNTEGLAKVWLDHNAIEKGILRFHDPAGIYADRSVIRIVDFRNDDVPQWTILEMNAYVPPQQDLS